MLIHALVTCAALTAVLDHSDLERFVATAQDAAHDGRFTMSLTMHAVAGTRP